MPAHSEQQHSPYTTRQLYDLVLDIERYPEFLPWCRAARILERNGNELLAELVISFKHMSESYVSRVTLTPPESDKDACHIMVEMVRGPFEHLINRWSFVPEVAGGTSIDFFLDFKFRSKLMEMLIGQVFASASAKMVTAFNERANSLYGYKK